MTEMKKPRRGLRSILLLALLCAALVALLAVTVSAADNDWTFDSSTGTITSYKSYSDEIVTVPDNIGGVPVTAIGEYAFMNHSEMTHTNH